MSKKKLKEKIRRLEQEMADIKSYLGISEDTPLQYHHGLSDLLGWDHNSNPNPNSNSNPNTNTNPNPNSDDSKPKPNDPLLKFREYYEGFVFLNNPLDKKDPPLRKYFYVERVISEDVAEGVYLAQGKNGNITFLPRDRIALFLLVHKEGKRDIINTLHRAILTISNKREQIKCS